MKDEVHPLRVLLKAILLFIALNVMYAVVDPPVGKLSLYNHVLPGRLRFPYEQDPSYYFVGYNAPVYEDFDAMFGAHVISGRKRSDEFRLILLGDSATWGISVQAGETLAERLNRLQIRTCDGRTVHAYNLGYPMPFLMRDALILDKAMEYEPDMVLWLVTLYTLEPKKAETYFIHPHAERYERIVMAHGITSPQLAEPARERSFWDQTLIGERRRLKKLVLTQMLGLLWAGTGVDNHQGLQPVTSPPKPDVSDHLEYEGWQPEESARLFDSLMFDVLLAGVEMAGKAPVVLVNEPIFLAEGRNHLIRYNAFYPRWAYDAYRRWITEWAQKENLPLLDYWDALPPSGFSDQNFHRSSPGEEQFARLLAPEINRLVCSG
jgi:hypothetical protein